jgi:hypothetical protein
MYGSHRAADGVGIALLLIEKPRVVRHKGDRRADAGSRALTFPCPGIIAYRKAKCHPVTMRC